VVRVQERKERRLFEPPPWLDEERVRRARKAARRIVRESLSGERRGSLAEAIRSLYEVVPREEWLARAVARLLLGTVERVSESVWRVYGVPGLGDSYSLYVVSLREGRYECTCFTHSYGYVRRARICTHIAAVMLRRRQLKLVDYGGSR
jgi:hypothetical protein